MSLFSFSPPGQSRLLILACFGHGDKMFTKSNLRAGKGFYFTSGTQSTVEGCWAGSSRQELEQGLWRNEAYSQAFRLIFGYPS